MSTMGWCRTRFIDPPQRRSDSWLSIRGQKEPCHMQCSDVVCDSLEPQLSNATLPTLWTEETPLAAYWHAAFVRVIAAQSLRYGATPTPQQVSTPHTGHKKLDTRAWYRRAPTYGPVCAQHQNRMFWRNYPRQWLPPSSSASTSARRTNTPEKKYMALPTTRARLQCHCHNAGVRVHEAAAARKPPITDALRSS